MDDRDLRAWDRYLTALPALLPWVSRGVALHACESTQDECFAHSRDRVGVVVTTLEQTAGRGRRGRAWSHNPQAGLAVTVSFDPTIHATPALSLAGGLAAAMAARTWIVGEQSETVGIKWPNDVVAISREDDHRVKLAGVLVEVRDGVALLGIGINVGHTPEDFPPELRSKASSIWQLAEGDASISRLDVLGTLLMELDRLIRLPLAELTELWQESDVLTGTEQTFEHGGVRRRGRVLSIDPAHEIVLISEGREHRLPALTTTLVKDDDLRAAYL